ncbi:MAG: hypothetical protein IJA61_04130 [Clostridia bacterium]|nr:hypothetical protein [Clostridia bacterium]
MALPSPKDIFKAFKSKFKSNTKNNNAQQWQSIEEFNNKYTEIDKKIASANSKYKDTVVTEDVKNAFISDSNHPAAMEEEQRIRDAQQAANPFQVIEDSTEQKKAAKAVEELVARGIPDTSYKHVEKLSPGSQQTNNPPPPQLPKDIHLRKDIPLNNIKEYEMGDD